MAPRETENNAYAKFWGDKQRTLWYVMVFLEWSILSWAEIFHSSYYYSLSGSFVTFFIVVRKVIKSLNNSFCSNWNAML